MCIRDSAWRLHSVRLRATAHPLNLSPNCHIARRLDHREANEGVLGVCGRQEPYIRIEHEVCTPGSTPMGREERNSRLQFNDGGFRLDCGCWRQTMSSRPGRVLPPAPKPSCAARAASFCHRQPLRRAAICDLTMPGPLPPFHF